MERRPLEPPHVDTSNTARALLVAAFIAFALANVIHNRFGLDPAIIPATVFVALLFWRPRPWILLAAACVIGVPSLLFFRLGAFNRPTDTLYVLNHVCLFLAALLAIGGALVVARRSGVSLTR